MDNLKVNTDVSQYFDEPDWNKMSSYEKIRLQNMYNNYLDMIKSGFNFPKPYFMNSSNKEIKTNTYLVKKTVDIKSKPKDVLDNLCISTKKRIYPKRNIARKNYAEEEEIPVDRYVYCDVCMNEYIDSCEKHFFFIISDNSVPTSPRNRQRAHETVPCDWLEIRASKIENAGDGVWTHKQILPRGVRFGPYEGKFGRIGSDGQYCWQIRKDGKVESYIDGYDPTVSNWMRYVNCARNREEQNLMAFQYFGQIYYRTVVDVEPNTELLVFYGSKFAKELGIDIKTFNLPLMKPLEENVFKCTNCYLIFSNSRYLKEHFERCNRNRCKITEIHNNDNTEMQIDHKFLNECTNDLFKQDDHTTKKKSYCESNDDIKMNSDIGDCYKCHLCPTAFSIESFYNKHMNRTHNIYASTPNYNGIGSDSGLGSNSSINSTGTNAEERIELPKTSHKCTVCDKVFTSACDLKRHDRIHSGIKSYICSICKKSFSYNSQLKSHLFIHNGIKAYKCTICSKSFTRSNTLKIHLLIHNGIKAFKCTICSKSFTRNNTLKIHLLIHNGIKAYKCTICSKSFTLNSYLNTHMKIHKKAHP